MGSRDGIERAVYELCACGKTDRAVEEALRGYGPEVYGFLVALLHDTTDADDVFSTFSEDVWKGLPRFDFAGATLRTWLYVLARHAAARHRRKARRAAVPISHPSVARIAAEVRSSTASYLRTERKDRLRALRESLPADDQALLVLRLDRDLQWDELAHVMLGEDGDDKAIKREAARLRKRFERLRTELLERARRGGLI